jgi:hypothetical protein
VPGGPACLWAAALGWARSQMSVWSPTLQGWLIHEVFYAHSMSSLALNLCPTDQVQQSSLAKPFNPLQPHPSPTPLPSQCCLPHILSSLSDSLKESGLPVFSPGCGSCGCRSRGLRCSEPTRSSEAPPRALVLTWAHTGCLLDTEHRCRWVFSPPGSKPPVHLPS